MNTDLETPTFSELVGRCLLFLGFCCLVGDSFDPILDLLQFRLVIEAQRPDNLRARDVIALGR
jgi:hypothetical protein